MFYEVNSDLKDGIMSKLTQKGPRTYLENKKGDLILKFSSDSEIINI